MGLGMSLFKPNSSRVDKLENQVINLRQRVSELERDLTYLYKHYVERENENSNR